MKIYRHPEAVPPEARGAVIALGNFDGIHRGHRMVIATAQEAAAAAGHGMAVMSFEPHPQSFFEPEEAPFRLTPFHGRVRLLAALGVERLFVWRFDAHMASLPAADFVQQMLAGGTGASAVIVGENFAFGRNREGDVDFLTRQAAQHGFAVTVVPQVTDEQGRICSSTTIRRHLYAGEMAEATAMLGHYWEIEGRVRGGDRRGRTIGFPTANLTLGAYARPAMGVYAVRGGVTDGARGGGTTRWYEGVANIGVRPTVDGSRLLLETHLFDFDGDLYGKRLRVAFVDFLRPEQRFESFELLRQQIGRDSQAARQALAAAGDDSGLLIR